MAISISILIVVIGLISLFSLPVEQYPDIAPPTVQVSATYTGADAEAVMNSVIMPLEESINGVEDMMYITSTATNAGTATIEVYFKQGTDPDMAAVNVQNRVSKAQGLLPAEVTKIGVTTQKRQTSFLQINALASTDGRYACGRSRRCDDAGRYVQYAHLVAPGTYGTIWSCAFGCNSRIGRTKYRGTYRFVG